MSTRFDVVVIGGGHAGCEAAAAAARMGARTALGTHRSATVGPWWDTPAWGGWEKAYLGGKVEALAGLRGRVPDLGATNSLMPTRRKGPAVHGPRAQADR